MSLLLPLHDVDIFEGFMSVFLKDLGFGNKSQRTLLQTFSEAKSLTNPILVYSGLRVFSDWGSLVPKSSKSWTNQDELVTLRKGGAELGICLSGCQAQDKSLKMIVTQY